jgi:hypothetical protein
MAHHPSEDAVRALLRERGAAVHVVSGGAEGLIAAWRNFVAQVEAGYPLGLDDYRNDLDIRTLIEVARLSDQVAEEDARLRRMLAHPEVVIWESDVPDAFWVRGYPVNASGELLEDIGTRGPF